MAGNFTINVVVTGAGGQGQGGGQGGGGQNVAATSAVAGLAAGATREQQIKQAAAAITNTQAVLGSTLSKDGKTLEVFRKGDIAGSTGQLVPTHVIERYDMTTRKIKEKQSFLRPRVETIKGTYQPLPGDYMWNSFQQQGKTTDALEAEFDVGYSKLGEHLIKNSQRYKALTTVAVYKTVSSAIAVVKHQSGDTYYNQQLSNTVKAASYMGAIALAGPAAPFVAAGIVVNELADGIVGAMNYAFDRKLERAEITNNQILAGNASYGRMRGVGV